MSFFISSKLKQFCLVLWSINKRFPLSGKKRGQRTWDVFKYMMHCSMAKSCLLRTSVVLLAMLCNSILACNPVRSWKEQHRSSWFFWIFNVETKRGRSRVSRQCWLSPPCSLRKLLRLHGVSLNQTIHFSNVRILLSPCGGQVSMYVDCDDLSEIDLSRRTTYLSYPPPPHTHTLPCSWKGGERSSHFSGGLSFGVQPPVQSAGSPLYPHPLLTDAETTSTHNAAWTRDGQYPLKLR